MPLVGVDVNDPRAVLLSSAERGKEYLDVLNFGCNMEGPLEL